MPLFDEKSKIPPLSYNSLVKAKKGLQKQRQINKKILKLAGIYFNQKNN